MIEDFNEEEAEEVIFDFAEEYSQFIFGIESWKNDMGLLGMANNVDITPMQYLAKKSQYEWIVAQAELEEENADVLLKIEQRMIMTSIAHSLDRIARHGGGFPI